MNKVLFIILIAGMCFFGEKLVVSKRVHDYCYNDEECVCIVGYMLDHITYRHRYQTLKAMEKGEIPKNPDTIQANLRATFVCTD